MWLWQITVAVEDMQRKKKDRTGGPLAEVDYWRERETAVSALYDQFNAPAVAAVLELFARVDSSMELLRRDIGKLYEEANDITRSGMISVALLFAARHLPSCGVCMSCLSVCHVRELCQNE